MVGTVGRGEWGAKIVNRQEGTSYDSERGSTSNWRLIYALENQHHTNVEANCAIGARAHRRTRSNGNKVVFF